MTATGRTTMIASGCLALSMVACVFLLRHMDPIGPPATMEDAVYINSPKLIKRASLGFDGVMACIYWTRTVQYFGHRHFNAAHTYNQLAPLLEITTALDPQLLPAYQFGASFLAPAPPNGAGEPDRAIQLMEYGIKNNPNNWHLYYDLGFVYYTEVKDYQKASKIFDQGSKLPNAHPVMKVLAAQMAEHAGEFSTARLLWSATYDSSRDPDIRKSALEHLRAIRADEDVTVLQSAVTRFRKRTGRLPSSMAELAAAEYLPRIPADPDGHQYRLTPEGHVEVENPDDFKFLTKGMPAGYTAPALPEFHAERTH
jgi:tetratricopeptide (TPR) repeat protein